MRIQWNYGNNQKFYAEKAVECFRFKWKRNTEHHYIEFKHGYVICQVT